VIVAGAEHADLIETQMHGAAHRLIVEPCARNTAPAIALAAALLDRDAIMLVCPSDHHIADADAFRAAALAAAELAAQDHLVAFGIAADRPETGYGYIRRGEPRAGGYAIAQFVEKPDRTRAEAYLASGEYSWNGGIFAFRAGALLDELTRHRPAMAQNLVAAVANGTTQGSRFRPDPDHFAAIIGESIDYAIMEHTDRAAMVPADMGWSDIGNFAALHDALEQDGAGNAVRGPAELVQCDNVLAVTDGPRISAIGVSDLCIVVSGDEVLVTTRDGAQLVGRLKGASEQ
jgi:mannose-1-phosphate guanylyltransferase/mannose-1-phosphate guanylyltransferase/mannose-6-phosphate isomerase